MAEKKRIALFLDGTWNTVNDNTNVWRLKSLCAKSSEQLVYYSAGVGTQFGEHILGGMFGVGINEEVISAYEWLVENYEQDAQLSSPNSATTNLPEPCLWKAGRFCECGCFNRVRKIEISRT